MNPYSGTSSLAQVQIACVRCRSPNVKPVMVSHLCFTGVKDFRCFFRVCVWRSEARLPEGKAHQMRPVKLLTAEVLHSGLQTKAASAAKKQQASSDHH